MRGTGQQRTDGHVEGALAVHDRFLLRSLGLVSLKNLSSPVEAWEVDGEQHAMAEPSTADRIPVERNGG